jgi:hypothetical protein
MNYLSEGLGDMLVLVFGPPKPFREAEVHIRQYLKPIMAFIGASGCKNMFLDVMLMGHRFGVTPDNVCLAVPYQEIPPTN